MTKHTYKNSKDQEPQNRINKVNSSKQDFSHQFPQDANLQTMRDSHIEEIFIPEQEIQIRAYELYQQKGGSDFDNWLEAEKSLRKERHHVSK